MPERIDTKAVLEGIKAAIAGEGKPSAETLLVWWKALAQEIADHEADRKRLMEYDESFRLYDEAMRRGTKLWQEAHPESAHVWPDAAKLAAWLMARIEELEIKAATWLALASPMWVGDESEGHFVCLACNQPGTDDGGTKTIQHLPNCEYAAALAAREKRA